MGAPPSLGTKLGRYEIRSKLGEGGMGEVYLAQDTKLDRKVALKILPAEVAADRSRINRFVHEAKAASALNHPNIITIHEIDQTDSGHFIATEFIDGETLRDRLRKAPMKLGEVLDVATQIASALSAAHAAGIIHRDVKPENVMLRRDGIVKVLDFGLAKITLQVPRDSVDTEAPTRAAINTDPGVVMGTAVYMSPEQARGLQVDARTDVFSLGVLIYEMVAGRLPFEGSNMNEILASILSDKEPLPLARYARDVPAELERIVEKALSKDRDERYQTAKDMLLDLRRLKHKLEVDAEIDRTVPPELRSGAGETKPSGGQEVVLTGQASSAEIARVENARTRSSVEYVVSGIKQNKIAALIALAVIAAGIFGVSVYLRSRNSEVTIGSIAVLPFVNQNNDPNTEYLSDGIPESVINSLSQLTGVKVIARSSSFKYKGKEVEPQEVAKALGVEAIVTGKVLQRGDDLLINAELVNARDKTQIWGEQYNRKVADLLRVQAEISQEISAKLRLKLSGAERQQLAKRPTDNLKAFQYYIQGRTYSQRRTREDLLTAVRYYEKAIEEDRNYALAFAGLADAYRGLGVRGYIAPIEGRRKEEEAARKALALDENLADAHWALGQAYLGFAPYNFSLADRELRRALELSPSLASAHLTLGVSLIQQGRLDEALEVFLKGRELDPLASNIARQVALAYYLKRDYVRALELLRQANGLGPAFTTQWEVGAYIQNGLFNEALAELEKAKPERPNDPILICFTGMVYAGQGKRAEALQIIKKLEELSGANLSEAHRIAKIYAALNDKELALTWLERGLATGTIAGFFKDDPVWDPIRSDARFADLLRRMGIPQ